MTEVQERLSTALADRYRFERELGEGGMATVYLAEDLKHHRKVALKVLRSELAAVIGAERFLGEIRTTANLQHPHILPLFDSGEAGGFLFYVMPYVEGESLRALLTREKQLSVGTAIEIGTQVAGALDYAHRHGVIHRDIKPENILLHDGSALVADFGIALAVSAAGTRMTETGMSLGTPHYMSPEQAMGQREITARSDVYALACVVYEMLTGEPPFTGPTAQSVVARVLTEAPRSLTVQRHTIPRHVEAAVLTGLEKLPADRFASAAEFARALEGGPVAAPTIQRRVEAIVGPRDRRTALIAGLGAALAIALGLALWSLTRRPPAASAPVRRWSILLPDSAPLVFIGSGTLGIGRLALAISPDGRTLVYLGRRRGTEQLFRRQLDETAVTPIPGTEGAYDPFFSPDGQWIGFFAGSELRKVPVLGGQAITLAQVPEPAGATWSDDGRIVVGAREGDVLARIPGSGGELKPVPNPQNIWRPGPRKLPEGHRVLVRGIGGGIRVTDLETGHTLALTLSGPVPADSVARSEAVFGFDPRYLAPGHLLYMLRGRLIAAPFDPVELRLLGPPVEVVDGVRHDFTAGQYVVTPEGTLIYAPGSVAFGGAFVWADSAGAVDSLPFPSQMYGTFDLAPGAHRVVTLAYPAGAGAEIWVLDLDRGVSTKIATQGIPSAPRWWPDGRRVVFTETSPTPPYRSVTIRQLAGSSRARDTLLIGWSVDEVSPDTTRLEALGSDRFGNGVWLIPLDHPDQAVPVDSFPTAWGPTFSRDGRWIAYTSNEAGRYEVYVVNRDLSGERQKVSLAGGEEPRWSPRGDALIYRWGQQWFSVRVPIPPATDFGRPRLVLAGPYVNVPGRSHDVAADGRHLVVMGPLDQTIGHLEVVTNWVEEVRRLAPTRP